MNAKDKIKYWDANEENDLINEINNLVSIEQILLNHDRKIKGITMRIEKLINNPEQSKKIKDITQVVTKYLNIPKPKNQIDYDKLYEDILKYNTLEEISKNYNNIQIPKIKNILNVFLDKKSNDMSKKLRIKCLLGSTDQFEFAENVYKNKINNQINNQTEQTNNLDFNSVIICLLGEIKSMRTDLFDIKNRVKVIMDKVDKIEKKNYNNYEMSKDGKIIKGVGRIKKNNIQISNEEQENEFISNHNHNNNINMELVITNGEKIQDSIKNIPENDNQLKIEEINANEKNDKHKINKQVEKIIMSSKTNKKINVSQSTKYVVKDELIDDYDEDELEKEFAKYLK